jgi:hypothetical protein
MDPKTTKTTTKKVTERVESQGQLLVDTRSVNLQLVEAEQGGKVIVRGEFATAESATQNKRLYPRKLWERELRRLEPMLTERQVFGELDHPADGRTQLNRTSHIVTNLKINEDGTVYGEAEALDTERGKNLQALLKAGCKVGVSSRGYGSTRTSPQGEEVVQDDYRLVTFDFVAEPAHAKAFPDVFIEEKGNENMETVTTEEVAKQVEEAKRVERERLTEEFSREVLNKLGTLKSEIREQLRGEFLSDPSVAASLEVVERIKEVIRPFVVDEDNEAVRKQHENELAKLRTQIQERDLKLRDLEAENDKLGETVKDVGYRYYLEQLIGGDADAEFIRKVVGDIKLYAKAEDLKTKVEAVKAEITKEREKRAKVESKLQTQKRQDDERRTTDRQRRDEEVAELKNTVQKMEEALESSLSANKEMAIKIYTEQRLTNHPKAAKIRKLIENASPKSRDEIDELFENFREPTQDLSQLDNVRARVRRHTQGGLGSTPEDEERRDPKASRMDEDYNGLGMSAAELQKLSGLGR